MNNYVFNTTADQLKTSIYGYSTADSAYYPVSVDASGNLNVIGSVTISNTNLSVTFGNVSFGSVTFGSVTFGTVTLGTNPVNINGGNASDVNVYVNNSVSSPIPITAGTTPINVAINSTKLLSGAGSISAVDTGETIMNFVNFTDYREASIFVKNLNTATIAVNLRVAPTIDGSNNATIYVDQLVSIAPTTTTVLNPEKYGAYLALFAATTITDGYYAYNLKI